MVVVGFLYHPQYHRTEGYVYQGIENSTFCTKSIYGTYKISHS